MSNTTEEAERAVQASKLPSLTAGGRIEAIVPQNLDEAWRLSITLVKAGMVPKSYEGRTPEETTSKVMIGIMKGLEVGFKPITALSSIMIVNQCPCIWGDGAIALVQNSGKLEWSKEWHEGTPGKPDWTGLCQMKRFGQPEIYYSTFSYADADRAKLLGKPGPWMAYPQRMLQMRARSWTIRDGFSDVLCGLGIVEEVQDMPPEDNRPVDTGFLDDAPAPVASPPPLIADGGREEASVPCEECAGSGTVAFKDETGEGKMPCPACRGSGGKSGGPG